MLSESTLPFLRIQQIPRGEIPLPHPNPNPNMHSQGMKHWKPLGYLFASVVTPSFPLEKGKLSPLRDLTMVLSTKSGQ